MSGELAKDTEGYHLHFNGVVLRARKIFSRPKEINLWPYNRQLEEADSAE